MEILYRSKVNNKTNSGDYAKQYFIVAKNTKCDAGLIIIKYVLSSDVDLYENKAYSFKKVKTYKGKNLYKTHFSIRITTLMQLLKDLRDNNVFKLI